ncbi:TonB-dependent receptor [Gammaproteobacteria bacterium AB-CW1]|uniref:TonB-dependent receptor n=1 Tax=Natronospira elongata TaxID=3110268 RepID=A0AAP6MJT5_9GAMM|nr:TonB-dependent receptor [Gammaproteobacteria bacterium AB-CW1]
MSNQNAFDTKLAVAVFASLAWMTTANGLAVAETDDTDDESQAELERVQVTGSRIRGVDLEGVQPLLSFDREDLDASGQDSLIDFLRLLPQMGGGEGTFTTAQSGTLTGDSPAGAAGVSLRSLGTASTLVLVNGRRTTVASFANQSESFVDINSIPMAAVDRVDVLATGASAIYGADAVAGVVNVILRDDLDGGEVRLGYGDSAASSNDSRSSINVAFGRNFENGNVTGFIDYYDRSALRDRDRSITAVEPFPSQQGRWPSFNVDPDLIQEDFIEESCPPELQDVGRFGEFCSFNRNAFTDTVPPTERIGGGVFAHFDITDRTRWYADFIYQQNRSEANSAPAPWSGEIISLDHPDIPTDVQEEIDERADELDQFGIDPLFQGWGRFNEARAIDLESDTWRLVTGLDGITDGNWEWDTALTVARNRSVQRAISGIMNREKFRAGLFGELCPDGSVGCDPETDGLWYNPFGGQDANSPEVLDLVRERVPRRGESGLYGIDFSLAGDLASLRHGALSAAFGAEFRHEYAEDNPSPLATADPDDNFQVPVFGFGSTDVEADRNVVAAYAEFNVPLAENFDMQLAGRFDHYSDFSGAFSPKVGFRWQPHERFLMRGSWAQAFRAPSLAQVGAGITLSSGTLPCSEDSEFFDNWCEGEADDLSYLSQITGNPDLEAEDSDSWNFGIVTSPTDDLTISLDYWRFEHTNLVDIDDAVVFRDALNDPDLIAEPGGIGPGNVGIETMSGDLESRLWEVFVQLINVGEQKTDGVDLSIEQRIDLGQAGNLRLFLDATWINSFKRRLSTIEPEESLAGTWRYPEMLVNAEARWNTGPWQFGLLLRHTGSYEDDIERADIGDLARVSSWNRWDGSVSLDFDNESWLSLHVDNILDDEPPRVLGSSANVDLVNHTTMGRFYWLRYTMPFGR